MSLCDDLLDTYRRPGEKMIRQMTRICDTIPERCHADVYQAILEDLSADKVVGVKEIIAACEKIGAPHERSHYLPAESWVCDACGCEFRYHPAPSDDDKIDKNIHDVCPTCGFQPVWTIQKRAYGQSWSKTAEEIYQKHVGQALAKYSDKNPYFSRHKAERERAEDRKLAVDQKIAGLDDAKRWDLESRRE